MKHNSDWFDDGMHEISDEAGFHIHRSALQHKRSPCSFRPRPERYSVAELKEACCGGDVEQLLIEQQNAMTMSKANNE